MQTFLLLATAYAVAFDPIPKVEPLPPITDKMWEQSANQMKRIGLAFYDHESEYGHFPQDIKNANSISVLSWRVKLLPHMNEKELYKQFKLNEPWDSEHNKKLIEKMPKIYAPVRNKAKEGHTFYQGFVGEDAIFRNGKPVKLVGIADGTSNTAMIVEAWKAVPWTKPEDIPFDVKKDIPKLGGEFDGDFNMLMADGSIKKIKKNFNATAMKEAIQMSDGIIINWDEIEK